jgi:hypothetical protein
MTMATLAVSSPANRPVTTSACCTKSIGPGTRPCMRKPPSRTAAELELGMPRLSIGTSAVHATVLLAASGAAMPSGDPLPNSSLCRDHRCASL